MNFKKVVNLINNTKGNVVFSGVGKSKLILEKTCGTFSSLGISSYVLDANQASHGSLGNLQKNDTLIIASNSGNTNELITILKFYMIRKTIEGCTFLGLQLTDWEISLGLGILQKHDQFMNVSRNQVTVNLLGYATERSNPFDLSLEDKDLIEKVISGGVYKFARRCMSDEYPERLDYQSLDRFRVQRDFPIYYAPKYGCFAEFKRVI